MTSISDGVHKGDKRCSEKKYSRTVVSRMRGGRALKSGEAGENEWG